MTWLVVYLVGWLMGCAEADVVVRTSLGRLRGQWRMTPQGSVYAAFNGVPYALPPVRFQEAEEMGVYGGVLDASRDGEDCFQFDAGHNQYPHDASGTRKFVGSEDCLYLNVYSPKSAVRGDKMLPVMAYIHGGGYMTGSGASTIHGPDLLMDKDIILVTINYRLGPLGFLRLDDTLVPGNLGLKDQVAALRWVKKNIASFGGDAESITIFGESAGGACTHLLMHVPSAAGLFQRVISQSGTGDATWALANHREATLHGNQLTEMLGCRGETAAALACLSEKSPAEILIAAAQLRTWFAEVVFPPVVESEGGFLTVSSLSHRSSLPWMTGVNSGEGYLSLLLLNKPPEEKMNFLKNEYRKLLGQMMKYSHVEHNDHISNKIEENYLGDKNFSTETAKDMMKMFGDGMFAYPMEVSAQKHRGPVYKYYFSYTGEYTFTVSPGLRVPSHLGAAHGDDLIYLLSMKKVMPNLKFNKQDAQVSNLMLQLWTSFATNGKPRADWSEGGMREITTSGELVTIDHEPYSLPQQVWEDASEANLRIRDEL